MISSFRKLYTLSCIFIKEQLKEPVSFMWILLSPCAVFYLFGHSRGAFLKIDANYVSDSAWYYAYVAMSVSFFGFCFYIIGRRESGFTRSFIYTKTSRSIFLGSQLLSYSIISLLYFLVLYLATRLLYGSYDIFEFFVLSVRFYCCFLLFCIFGLVFSTLRISFQNANTILSIISFSMLALTVVNSVKPSALSESLNLFNPLTVAYYIMISSDSDLMWIYMAVIITLIITAKLSLYFFRTNPVWSRY